MQDSSGLRTIRLYERYVQMIKGGGVVGSGALGVEIRRLILG